MSRILPPCGTCERKGCGAYHDECEKYKEFKQQITDIRVKRQMESNKKRMPVNPYLKKKLNERSKDRHR